jgi:hypothetical protein
LEGKPQRIVGAGALDSPQSERFQLMFAAAPRHRPTKIHRFQPFDKSKFEKINLMECIQIKKRRARGALLFLFD